MFCGEVFAGSISAAGRETIVACAVRHLPTGTLHSGKFVHCMLIDRVAAEMGRDPDEMTGEFESGYMTSDDRFVDRREGAWMVTDGHPEQLDNCLRSEHIPDGLVVEQEADAFAP